MTKNTNTIALDTNEASTLDQAVALFDAGMEWTANAAEAAAVHTYKGVINTASRTTSVVTMCATATKPLFNAQKAKADARIARILAGL